MSNTLRRDIYSFSAPGFPIDEVEPPDPDLLAAARYSCIYWVNHLRYCGPQNDFRYGGSIDVFLRQNYLHWLEALSLLRCISEGTASILELERLFEARKERSLLIDRVRDARRFILYYKGAIEDSPLQVYASALIFSPTRSIIRNQFKNEGPEWIIQKPDMSDNWSACLQTLEGYDGWVRSVAWSHDASLLACESGDNTVKVWDSATGQCISTLEGHLARIQSLAWSYTNQLSSGSDDASVMIWNPVTGQCISTLEGHYNSVEAVAWSHDRDAAWFASASSDKTVIIWDSVTWQWISTLEGYEPSYGKGVPSIAWLRIEGTTLLASASRHSTIKIWDPATSQCISTLEGHCYRVFSVAWLHDTTLLASASGQGTAKIWDLSTNQCISTLEVPSDSVGPTAAWACNSTQLAWSTDRNTVKIWDIATKQCISTLEGHGDRVRSMAWSYNSAQLASASDDGTVKIWDLATKRSNASRFEGHDEEVTCLAWSHDATQLASVSYHAVKIWNPTTGQCLSTFQDRDGPNHRFHAVAWSYDATRLAVVSQLTIKIYDPTTWKCVTTLKLEGLNDYPRVSSMAWSCNSAQLASAFRQSNTIGIWDLATRQLSTLKGHHDAVNSMAWSRDATQIVSASRDKTLKIWDPATSQCISTLKFDCVIHNLQFRESNSDVLYTDLGTIDLRTFSNSAFDTDSADRFKLSQVVVGYGLSYSRIWITYQGKNLLWLPTDYRPSRWASAVCGTAVSIGCPSGRVLIFKFSDSSPISSHIE